MADTAISSSLYHYHCTLLEENIDTHFRHFLQEILKTLFFLCMVDVKLHVSVSYDIALILRVTDVRSMRKTFRQPITYSVSASRIVLLMQLLNYTN